MPQPVVMAYPKPPKAPDGSLIYERIPNKESPVTVAGAPVAITGVAGAAGSPAVALDKPVPMVVAPSNSLKRRHNDKDVNGLDSEYEGEGEEEWSEYRRRINSNLMINYFPGPPTKRPNKDPAPSHRPTQEQYQAMMAAAVAAGQPLPRHHVSIYEEKTSYYVSLCPPHHPSIHSLCLVPCVPLSPTLPYSSLLLSVNSSKTLSHSYPNALFHPIPPLL